MRAVWLVVLPLVLAACSRGDAKPGGEASPPAQPSAAAPDPRVARADLSRIAGQPNAKLWILIVSDFQCPYCKQYHDSTAKQVHQEFVETGKVRMAYIHYPLKQHPNAVPAAEASMCGGAQDKFWPFHDRLFATMARWSAEPSPDATFEGIAAELQLDMDAFRRCMSDDVMLPMIQADYERGVQAGANQTPTFLIGSRVVTGSAPISAFRTAVNEQLKGVM
ncbi:MAG: DsbA family protein [Gemmatimonadaceae bacterium]